MLPIRLLFVCAALPVCAAAQESARPLTLTLEEAQARARANAPQLLSANLAARMAAEDRVQSRSGLLPSVNWVNQTILTERNGSSSGVFISNDGPRVYNSLAQAHADVYAPAKRAEYQRAIAYEAAAKAKVEVAARGLAALVARNFYAFAAARRKQANSARSEAEAAAFVSLSEKLEQGGEAARADVVKARLEAVNKRRETAEAELAAEKARIELAVLLFPDFRSDFDVVDDLEQAAPLPPFADVEARAAKQNPDLRAASWNVSAQQAGVKAARSGFLPTFSVDYFFGLNANELAYRNAEGQRNLGSSVQASVSVPLWNWGETRSRVRQADLGLQQARADLSAAKRQLMATLRAFYLEAQAATAQLEGLRQALELSSESLRLTLLRYEAGEAAALEVVDAQSTLAQARNAFDDGLLRRRQAIADLQTLTGAF